ncbi:ShlB/FhaC/HecB family hemolysin secretion/activation protein [Propionispora vibrioides]|uniref:Hemolysin activation/secretion protein n=1 Tax=Propionispora vibrioides TaxID=112903 RepID=A0A1H8WS77_9FIRM|nr:ShlB/FhaC/HecB family hemolysin secretion/activation protein [Propionispora vibrioides]SEP30530.1 hemolysin activation/secretion protein [Propionispora vibrioides]
MFKFIHSTSGRRYAALAALLVLTITNTLTAYAQDDSQLDKEELRRRTQQETQERQNRQRQADSFLQKDIKTTDDTTLPEETISFPIHTVHLEGERIQAFSWLQEKLKQYQGRRIGIEGINLIVKRLTNDLIAHGYITTRIAIPEQDLSQGTLRLILIPGIIQSIRFASDGKTGYWQNAFPTRSGDILNLRALEQGLEQLKRVPSQDADMQIEPGEKPGESNIVITLKHTKPWRFSSSLDNSGSRATGKLQASATLSLDNLTNQNDLFYISLNNDAMDDGSFRGTNGSSFYYSLPYGYWTFSLSNSTYDYHQTVLGTNQTFPYSGTSQTTEFRAQRLLHRDQTSKTGAQFRIIKKDSRNYLSDTELPNQRKDVTADELALTHHQYYGKTVLDLDLAYRWGVPWFGAQPDTASGDSPTTRYQLWTLDANLSTPLKLGKKTGQYQISFRAQQTDDVLYTSDQFSIGNQYTVRGFDGEQTLTAENGWYVRNEISLPVHNGKELYLGLDYGRVSGPSAQFLDGHSLSGAVLGLRGSTGRFSYDVNTGWPLHKPATLETSSHPLNFMLNYQY